MENDSRILDVTSRAACRKHGAGFFDPCWWIWPLKGGRKARKPAVCNDRVLKAGFNGEIDPRSLRKR